MGTAAKLILENIGKRYRFEWIFRKINYEFESNTQYAILGPNGSGKSTFLKIHLRNMHIKAHLLRLEWRFCVE